MLKTIKLQTPFQRDINNCKEATILPVRTISGHVAIFLLDGAGNNDHVNKEQRSHD